MAIPVFFNQFQLINQLNGLHRNEITCKFKKGKIFPKHQVQGHARTVTTYLSIHELHKTAHITQYNFKLICSCSMFSTCQRGKA